MKTKIIPLFTIILLVIGNSPLIAQQGSMYELDNISSTVQKPSALSQDYANRFENKGLSTDSIRIYGPKTVCDNATYTIENLPMGATVEWKSSSNLTLVSGQGNTNGVFEKNGDGLCIIEASIMTDSEPFTLNPLEVWCGVPSVSPISGTQHFPEGGMGSYTVEIEHSGDLLYYWSVSPSVPISFSGKHAYIVFPAENGDFQITLTVINCCGSTRVHHFVSTGEYEPFE